VVAHQIAIGCAAVVPEIFGLIVLLVEEVTLDLEIGVVIFRLVQAGGRPVPGDFGRVLGGHRRDVTGLAGYGGDMGVDAFVVVQVGGVAVGARHLVLVVHTHGQHAPGDDVIVGLVAVGAEEIVLPMCTSRLSDG
jgi:hypothetical protein